MGFRTPYESAVALSDLPVAPGPPRRRGVAAHTRVLFVGNDPADVRLARNVLEEDAEAKLRVVADAHQAIALLAGADGWKPALVVVDLDVGAGRVLAAMRADPRLTAVPVVVLTGIEGDVANTYRRGASCVMLRPRGLDGFFDAMRAIQRFWLETAVLPQP